MTRNDFEFVAELLRQRSGLMLTEDKAYLLESRLNPVARKHGLKGLEDLVQALRLRREEALMREVTEAMTTNESFFFRDIKPFDQFRDLVLPQLLQRRGARKSIRVWSAACSSGQEPYSLAMLVKEQGARLAGWTVEIVATDLSSEVLDKAKQGAYSQFEVQRGLPITLLMKYFKQDGDQWRIDPALRAMISFRSFNLLDNPASLGRFDVVFLRNVLIYFEQANKAKVLERVARQIAPDGFLYLGGAETVLGLTDSFQLVPGQRGIYCPTASQPQAAAS